MPEEQPAPKRIERIARRAQAMFALIGVVVTFIVVGHCLVGAAMYLKGRLSGSARVYDLAQLSPVYDGFADPEALWRATAECTNRQHYEPYVIWRRDAYTSKYINIDEHGVRRTVKSPKPGAAKVFMFGGSTTWGTGSPDSHTIPSLLQKRLGDGYDVHNFGDIAYVAAQELNLLLKLLADGNVPQIVIFYDGINDGSAGAYSPGVPRDPEAIRMEWEKWERSKRDGCFAAAFKRSSYPQLAAFLRSRLGLGPRNRWEAWDKQVAALIDGRAAKAVEYYGAHIRQVQALAKGYGFKVFFFWQPNLLAAERKAFACETAIVESQSPVLVKSQQLVHQYAKKAFSNREDEGVFFLGDVLNDFDQATFVDWCHPDPKGNDVIAARIFELIKDHL